MSIGDELCVFTGPERPELILEFQSDCPIFDPGTRSGGRFSRASNVLYAVDQPVYKLTLIAIFWSSIFPLQSSIYSLEAHAPLVVSSFLQKPDSIQKNCCLSLFDPNFQTMFFNIRRIIHKTG